MHNTNTRVYKYSQDEVRSRKFEVPPWLSYHSREQLIDHFVTSKLDCCNGLLYGLSNKETSTC